MRAVVSVRGGLKGLIAEAKAKIGHFSNVRAVELYDGKQLQAVVYIGHDRKITVALSNEPMSLEVLSKGPMPVELVQTGDRNLYTFTQ